MYFQQLYLELKKKLIPVISATFPDNWAENEEILNNLRLCIYTRINAFYHGDKQLIQLRSRFRLGKADLESHHRIIHFQMILAKTIELSTQ